MQLRLARLGRIWPALHVTTRKESGLKLRNHPLFDYALLLNSRFVQTAAHIWQTAVAKDHHITPILCLIWLIKITKVSDF